MRVLVTGGAGYIGSHTCKALARAGHLPVCLDNFQAGHRSFVRWGPLVEGDVRDASALMAALRAHQIDAVIHFAGRIAVGESVAFPLDHYEVNVGGTIALLQAMRACGVDALVYSSSAAVYGIPEEGRIGESAVLAPISPYGRTKATAEAIVADAAAAHKLRAVALRYFNAAGADSDAEVGEWHEPETHLVPLAIRAAMTGEHFTLNGTDYPTPDGTCIRDFVHVEDLAQAHVASVEALVAGRPLAAAMNVGAGIGHSVRTVLAMVEQVTERPVRVIEGARRPGDPPELVAHAGLIEACLGWSARKSDLRTIVASAWRWHRRMSRSQTLEEVSR